jgi:mannosylglycerate hydrolase
MSNIHVVSHTHWDREWYKPFQYFRIKLVYVIDHVLEILEKDNNFKFFMLDGQTIVLEDYLQIKPENEQRIRTLVEAGRLIIGPWYIQPDEFAPDGESLIRNLLIGINISEKFGKPMMVGYLPDSFGQTGQLPHILKGFGIDSAVMMRGVASQEINASEFIWEGTNGEQVLALYLPLGYSNAMFLPEDYLKNKLRLSDTTRKLKKWATTDNLLVMNGVDHQFPQAHIAGHVQQLNDKSKKHTYIHSTIEQYIEAINKANPSIPKLSGDLLAPTRNRVHSSIASTRIYQKQQNRRMEALLEKYVEPIATLAWALDAEYPTQLINQAWKILIQNQTHDGICGCCTDEVHREMDQRFVDVRNMGKTLRDTFSRAISRRISTDNIALVAFNNAMTVGKQLVKATVFTKNANFILRDSNGKHIPYQIKYIEEVDTSQLSIWTLYMDVEEDAKKVEFSFYADFDFNVGYKIYDIVEGKQENVFEDGIEIKENRIETPFYRIEMCENGSINLLDKDTGFEYQGLLIFEDCGDAGDTYNYSPVMNDTVITSRESLAKFEVLEQGIHQTTVQIQLDLAIPKALINADQERSKETVTLPISTQMTLYKDQKRIDFVSEVDNTANDHRLRVLFPTGILSEHAYAETQFGTAKRPNQIDTTNWEKEKWSEKPLPIYSQQKFVDLNDGVHGLAVLNRGLPEYEIYDDTTIAITLLRGVGSLGKENLLIRPGRPSGMIMPTPDAQCHRKHTLEYAIFPHAGDVDQENVPKIAAELDATPLAVQSHIRMDNLLKKRKLIIGMASLETLTSHVYDQIKPLEKSDFKLVTIRHDHLIISAVKKAEEENALIIRIYNSSAQPVKGAVIELGMNVQKAQLTNFNENVIGELIKGKNNGYVIPTVNAYSAITMQFLIQA